MSSYRVLGLGQPLLDRILQVDEEVMVRMGMTERGGSSLFNTAQELDEFKSKLEQVLSELSGVVADSSSSSDDSDSSCNDDDDDDKLLTSAAASNQQSLTTLNKHALRSSLTTSLSISTTTHNNNTDIMKPLSPTSPYYYQLTPHELPVQSHVKQAIIVPGGSCANTIKGLASFGEKCGFIGKIGKDQVGQLYKDSMQQRGIIPLMTESMSEKTGEVICLITPNGERTMKAFLGASLEMTLDDLLPQDFAHLSLLHVEGYSIYNQPLTLRAMQLAKQNQSMVSFDLGSFELVRQFKPLLLDMLRNYVDIVFSNSEEARELMGVSYQDGYHEANGNNNQTNNNNSNKNSNSNNSSSNHIAIAEQCVDYLAKFCKVAVVMMGKDGCWVKSGNEKYQCPADVVQNPVDTTGAGDLFASGFIYAYLQGYSLQQCARMGALSGKEVLFVMGAEVPMDRFKKIKSRVNSSVFHTDSNSSTTTSTKVSISKSRKHVSSTVDQDDDDEAGNGTGGFVIGECSFSAGKKQFI